MVPRFLGAELAGVVAPSVDLSATGFQLPIFYYMMDPYELREQDTWRVG